jgi:N-acetylglucosaminyldiphosphoundecaprenol N-acetyl-beta-D-mannosaminyltransferase
MAIWRIDVNACAMTSRETPEETPPPRYYIGAMGVSVTTMAQALRLLERQVRKKRPAYVCAANLEATMMAQRDARFRGIQNHSFLTVPDGMPLVWYARILGIRGVARVTGPDLLLEVLKISAQHGFSHYFYGDTCDTLAALKKVVADRFPGALVKGVHSPPFRELDDEEISTTVAEINRLHPSFVWVGLGCPKQEQWMARVLPHIQSAILVGVGAAFRFVIGQYRHPPRVLQSCGLEGVFWRVPHGPGGAVRWYGRHMPACGLLMLKALAKRVTQSSPSDDPGK